MGVKIADRHVIGDPWVRKRETGCELADRRGPLGEFLGHGGCNH